jgi:hypothetical protein
MKQKDKNILEHAHEIIYERAEESARKYGPFSEGMEKVAQLSSIMCNKDISPEDCYKVLIALKLSRESYNKKYDNILDAISYMAAMYNHFKDEYDKTK